LKPQFQSVGAGLVWFQVKDSRKLGIVIMTKHRYCRLGLLVVRARKVIFHCVLLA